jgi:4-aminobutyrate aminotransferase-like enzyme
MLGIVLDGKHESIGPAIGRVCLQHGVYVGYYGENNNVLRVQPALTMNPSTAIRAARKIVASIAAFEKNPSAAIMQWKKSASISWVPNVSK